MLVNLADPMPIHVYVYIKYADDPRIAGDTRIDSQREQHISQL